MGDKLHPMASEEGDRDGDWAMSFGKGLVGSFLLVASVDFLATSDGWAPAFSQVMLLPFCSCSGFRQRCRN